MKHSFQTSEALGHDVSFSYCERCYVNDLENSITTEHCNPIDVTKWEQELRGYPSMIDQLADAI
mgnify:CR=1 FL=1